MKTKSFREPEIKIYFDSKGTTIAVCKFAGKTIKGVAKLHPKDTFDKKTGIELATARCMFKVADLRQKNAFLKYASICDAYDTIVSKKQAMFEYYRKTNTALFKAVERIKIIKTEIESENI